MNVAALIHSDLRNENGSGAETKDAELESLGVDSGGCNTANDLVSWYQREFWIRQISVHRVKIGSAYGARVDADQYLAGAWLRFRQLRFAQRISRSKQNHRAHVLMIPASVAVGAVYDRPQCRDGNIAGGHTPPLQPAVKYRYYVYRGVCGTWHKFHL